jgi:hypothetical protein
LPETVTADPDLPAVIRAWPTLAEPVKAGILAMVRASGGGSAASSPAGGGQ